MGQGEKPRLVLNLDLGFEDIDRATVKVLAALGTSGRLRNLLALLFLGHCKKLSSRKNILEDRYIKLTTDGILSWYKGEDDSDARGSIQIRGEKISQDKDDLKVVFVHTKDRRYHFQLLDERDSNMWLSVLDWHTQFTPKGNTSVLVRNAPKGNAL